jgi:hypothetical protein
MASAIPHPKRTQMNQGWAGFLIRLRAARPTITTTKIVRWTRKPRIGGSENLSRRGVDLVLRGIASRSALAIAASSTGRMHTYPKYLVSRRRRRSRDRLAVDDCALRQENIHRKSVVPIVDLLLSPILIIAVAFLDFALEPIAMAIDGCELFLG